MKLEDNKNRGFISTFVGELYAILIGIGITSVIYDKTNLTNGLDIVMAIFVTIVVTLYWWDWAAYVSSYFVASSYEFVIDFINLVVLEFLFVYFNDVQTLAIIFFVLGIIDFVWVANYLWQSGEKPSLRNGWVQQKITAIFLYGVSLLIVAQDKITLPLELLVLTVIVTYALVRLFCFKGVKREASINLRAAKVRDIESILEINHQYVDKNLNDKFLISKLNRNDLDQLIYSDSKKILVSSDKSTILAYAIISYNIPFDLLNGIQWLDPSFDFSIQNKDYLYIDQIAVNPDFLRENNGREFYEKLINEQSLSSVTCAFVALEPRCNITSLKFHESLGFRKAALFKRDKFAGIENYKSLLLVRQEKT